MLLKYIIFIFLLTLIINNIQKETAFCWLFCRSYSMQGLCLHSKFGWLYFHILWMSSWTFKLFLIFFFFSLLTLKLWASHYDFFLSSLLFLSSRFRNNYPCFLFCNSIFAVLPDTSRSLWLAHNYAARLSYRCGKFTHINPILSDFHWLSIQLPSYFKILFLYIIFFIVLLPLTPCPLSPFRRNHELFAYLSSLIFLFLAPLLPTRAIKLFQRSLLNFLMNYLQTFARLSVSPLLSTL